MAAEHDLGFKPSEVIKGVRDIASIVVVGRNMAWAAKDKSPFYPDIEEWADKVWSDSGVDFWDVPPRQRLAISEQSRKLTIPLLHRAELQARYVEHPEAITENIVKSLNDQSGQELNIDPGEVKVVWGLYSYGLVLKEDDFLKVKKAQGLTSTPPAAGYVTGYLMGELGFIPIIKKGRKVNSVLAHEDLHNLQLHLGYMRDHDLRRMSRNPRFLSALYNGDIQPGDFDVASQFLDAVAADSESEIFLELQTNLWDKSGPSSTLLDNPNFGYVDSAITAVINSAYHPSTGLSEQQKLEAGFYALHSFNNLNYRRQLLSAYAQEAMKSYKGPLDKWQWTAAVAFTLLPSSSMNMFRSVMLGGRDKDLENPPNRLVHIDLAQAVTIYSKMTVDPDSTNQAGVVTAEAVDNFIDLIARTVNEGVLTGDVMKDVKMTPEEFERAKRKTVEYAIRSVPKEHAAKTEQILKERLGIE